MGATFDGFFPLVRSWDFRWESFFLGTCLAAYGWGEPGMALDVGVSTGYIGALERCIHCWEEVDGV